MESTPVLKTARLLLTPLQLDDAPAIQQLFPHWENEASRKISVHENMRLLRTQDGHFVSGPMVKEIWETTRQEWRRKVDSKNSSPKSM